MGRHGETSCSQVVIMKMRACLDIASSSHVEVDERRFGGPYCLYHQGDLIWNVGQLIRDYTAQCPRMLSSSWVDSTDLHYCGMAKDTKRNSLGDVGTFRWLAIGQSERWDGKMKEKWEGKVKGCTKREKGNNGTPRDGVLCTCRKSSTCDSLRLHHRSHSYCRESLKNSALVNTMVN